VTSTAVQIRASVARGRLGLRVGELVEVRSEEEILATLDDNAELDSLPFMPEMLEYCGARFTVYKVAHKLCDTMTATGMRRMRDAVHLAGVRCDGVPDLLEGGVAPPCRPGHRRRGGAGGERGPAAADRNRSARQIQEAVV
jgi:hypothetical protein